MSGEVILKRGYRLQPDQRGVVAADINKLLTQLGGVIAKGSITATELADGCITAEKLDRETQEQVSIPDGYITTDKLAAATFSATTEGRTKMADGFVTEAKLDDDAVSTIKIADGTLAADAFDAGVLDGSGVRSIKDAGEAYANTFPATTDLILAEVNSGVLSDAQGIVLALTHAGPTTSGCAHLHIDGLDGSLVGASAAGKTQIRQVCPTGYLSATFVAPGFCVGAYSGVTTADIQTQGHVQGSTMFGNRATTEATNSFRAFTQQIVLVLED